MEEQSSGIRGEETDSGSMVYLYAVSLIAAIGGLLFGFYSGVISGVIPFVTEHFDLTVNWQGFIVSSLVIGCIVGTLIAGSLSDRYGRKKVMIAAAFLFLVSAIMSALPRTVAEIVIARLISGIAVGTVSVLSPVYIAEIAPARIRGQLVSINQLAIVSGIFLTYLTNWLLVDMGPANWRWMFAVGAIPSLLFCIALFFIPESPRFLTKIGLRDRALSVLTRINGRQRAEIVLSEVENTMSQEKVGLSDLLKPGFRTVLIIGCLLAVLSQWNGMAAILYYTPSIFMKAGYESASSAFLASVAIGFVNIVFTIVAIVAVDRFGRKGLLLIGFTGMFISITLTGYIYQSATISGKIVIVPLLFFVAFFCMSVGAITWVLLSEIFPTKIRGTAMAIATMSLWVANFVLSQVFPLMINSLGGNTFYLFGLITFVAVIFTWKMIPETKNKTLEEIEQMWIRKAHA